ncbi:MAG: YafY family transcriptional regulator [Clostridia bacterium]|nr:YafY family transcriptional regulator [Clostridia bacterium]
MKFEILVQIIFLLLAKKRVTAAEIAAKYGVSSRSVYRYIDEISAIVPVYATRGPNGGYSLVDSFRLPSTFFTESEYSVTIQALEAFGREFPGEAFSALNKLKAGSRYAREINLGTSSLMIDSGPWGVTENYNVKLRVLEECVASFSAVKIVYRDAEGAVSERVIEPHVVVLKQGIWYVYAFCRLRCEFRLFKVGRIESETVLDEKFERRPAEGLDKALSFTAEGEKEEVVMEIKEEIVSEIEEWLGVDCVNRENGRITATAYLPVNGGLASKLLSYGGKIKIKSPTSLVLSLRSAADEILKIYGDNTR